VLAEIIRANPSLSRQEVRLLVSRNSDPNASCVGDGTLIIHIGLTRRFENESQLAFVICHELAHHQLNHVNQSIQQYVEKLYGRSTQREISRITSGDNRRVEKATELLRGIVYESSRHSRVNEAAADSLAVVLMRNTPYDELESLKVLALLDTVDTEKYRFPLPLKQSLDSPQYPFKDSWLQPSSLLKLEQKKSED
jgi:predicted Zn-dependent protease